MAAYAASGWTKVPSKKQALQAVEILRTAAENDDEIFELAGR
jgi:hypothetical protein